MKRELARGVLVGVVLGITLFITWHGFKWLYTWHMATFHQG
jgi:hypothetical protein